ncbi:MAG: hypothetical protein MAG581_00689 [Deltaproteobacteria bacterium]|nr:hypothetical protein [Deltaproteobacteria bacterium]
MMYIIKRTAEFDNWLSRIRNRQTKCRLLPRLEKVQRGLLGDVSPVRDGIYELREFFGPGWRMNYMHQGEDLIVMLGGGTKKTQSKDIAAANLFVAKLKEEQ